LISPSVFDDWPGAGVIGSGASFDPYANSNNFLLAAFFLLFVRFFWLQVVQHEHYRTRAEENRISLVPVVPNRGLIVDRHGIVLASNYSAYTLEIVPSKTQDLEKIIGGLAELIELVAGVVNHVRHPLNDVAVTEHEIGQRLPRALRIVVCREDLLPRLQAAVEKPEAVVKGMKGGERIEQLAIVSGHDRRGRGEDTFEARIVLCDDLLLEMRPLRGLPALDQRADERLLFRFGAIRASLPGLAHRVLPTQKPDKRVDLQPHELIDHFGRLHGQGAQRFYVWFSDPSPETIAEFAETVISR